MKRRLISLIVTICMIVNMLPMVVLGADEQYQIQVDDAIVLNKSLVPATATSPAKIRLEAYVNGTTSVSQQHKPADIVLVLDQSGSMADNVGQSTKLALLKSAAQAFIDEIAGMNNTAGDLYRVAVVGFASESGYGNNTEILTVKNRNSYGVAYNNLTTANYQNALVNCVADSEALNSAVQALAASGATRADLGMEMAAKIFDNQPAGTYDDRSKIVVFITDGEPTTSNRFSSSVANAAVTEAKDMKAEGAYIFSMYIGTPSSNASSFMQAVSSNYPDATRYNDLGTQAADSYYSAHNDASGVESMLKALKEQGKTLILATSKPEEFAIKILRHFGLDGYFTVMAGATMDSSRSKKGDVIAYSLQQAGITDHARTIMIGDREHDIIGARQNGLDSIGVLYGYGTRKELENAGATLIAPTVPEILPLC